MFIYVGDVYIASSNTDALNEFTIDLQKLFELKILGIPRQVRPLQYRAERFDNDKIHTKITPSKRTVCHKK